MMKLSGWRNSLFLLLGLAVSTAATDGPVAWWQFDQNDSRQAVDRAGSVADRIEGNFKFVAGAAGSGLKFDGFTTHIVRKAAQAPRLGEAFTIEAWVALGAYPWNWCPIASQEDESRGYYFGVDSQGRVGVRVAINGKWLEGKSEIDSVTKVGLDLRKWHHVASVYDPVRGLRIYQDGRKVAALPVRGTFDFAAEQDLFIGRNRKPLPPTHPVREWATWPSLYSFDGIIDEVKIHGRALSTEEITGIYRASRPRDGPDIPPRRFPAVRDTGRFGAYLVKLKYYEEWDALWRTHEHSDIVVLFDEHPVKVMFWRGTRYSPCWVSENGKWMADQSREIGENWNCPRPREEVPTGCCEHMSDTQTRFSRVRLIENNDARVVVHWRYALVDVLYRQARVDPQSGWGLWGDEIYTIYPDGVGVRHVLPGQGGWQETIFLNESDTRPEDNIELEALTLVNLQGESRSYSWERGYPALDLPEPVIQMTNLKSKYRPFIILPRGSSMRTFDVEVRPEYSHFPWWNHWPVAQVASDGRYTLAPDRAASSSLAWGRPNGDAALYGMTDKPALALVPLAKSWIDPPSLRNLGDGFSPEGYDSGQRAYVIRCNRPGSRLGVELAASENSPAVNPAFVIRNWGASGAKLEIDGRLVERGKSFRSGQVRRPDGIDLVIWIKLESTRPVRISLEPQGV